MRKVEIQSDGTSAGTIVINTETGEQIRHVTGVNINIQPHNFKAEITFLADVSQLTITSLECTESKTLK